MDNHSNKKIGLPQRTRKKPLTAKDIKKLIPKGLKESLEKEINYNEETKSDSNYWL